jgi:hypothetical protein
MSKLSRREAIREYKERKVRCGIYAVRCTATSEAWVGLSRNLDAQWNSIAFGLRTGGHANRALQAVWNAHGEPAFAFEALEVLDDEDMSPIGRQDALKRREAHWLAALGAKKAAG